MSWGVIMCIPSSRVEDTLTSKPILCHILELNSKRIASHPESKRPIIWSIVSDEVNNGGGLVSTLPEMSCS